MIVHHSRRSGKRTGSGSHVPRHNLSLWVNGVRHRYNYTDRQSIESLAARIAADFAAPPSTPHRTGVTESIVIATAPPTFTYMVIQ